MGETGGQLTEPGQRFLQSQLLFELHDVREIREQAYRGLQQPFVIDDRRDGHAEMTPFSGANRDRPANDR
ncbi:hypothetical protein D3C83_139300 [compost metagenome]